MYHTCARLDRAKRVVDVARRVALVREAARVEAKRLDKEQRRVEYENACEIERQYYERAQNKSIRIKRPRKTSTLSGPSHMRYLRKNKWIKGVVEYLHV
jgi:hypothetical protein